MANESKCFVAVIFFVRLASNNGSTLVVAILAIVPFVDKMWERILPNDHQRRHQGGPGLLRLPVVVVAVARLLLRVMVVPRQPQHEGTSPCYRIRPMMPWLVPDLMLLDQFDYLASRTIHRGSVHRFWLPVVMVIDRHRHLKETMDSPIA